jgi:hypothetical protein
MRATTLGGVVSITAALLTCAAAPSAVAAESGPGKPQSRVISGYATDAVVAAGAHSVSSNDVYWFDNCVKTLYVERRMAAPSHVSAASFR